MTTPDPTTSDRDGLISAHFTGMVMEQAQMALMLLGQMPHPETGEAVIDLDGAQMFIEQLEMLTIKTKGNLSRDEEQLLQQSLQGTRLAFVEVAQQQSAAVPALPSPVPSAPAPEIILPAAPDEEEARKRFSKKY